MPTLVLLQSGEATPFELDADATLLGRHPECTIQLQSNMVSRKHAQVTADGDLHFVEDLGSGNGTFVNGKKIEGKARLFNQDRIKLGPVLLRYESDHPAAQSDQPAMDATAPGFNVDIAAADDDMSTIMGAVGGDGGFGLLDVQPEAKLKAIIGIARSLAGTVDIEALLPKILDTLFNIFPHADRGCILLKNADTDGMHVAAQKHRREDDDETVRLSRTILNKVLEEKTGILSADAASDSRFDASESISALTIRSMMCVPMLSLDNVPMGVIHIDTQNPVKQFKTEDLDLLMAVAGQAALSYESTRLMESFLEKQKRDSELRIAHKVQEALLPEELPHVDGYQFYASYDAAQEVGGDYYDAMLLEDDKLCLSFGDVAGKGVPGALIMSRISSVVQSTMQFTTDVAEAIQAINNHMCSHMVEGRFVTYVLIVIDLNTHEMTLVNAGHMSPLIRKPDGAVDEFHEDTIGIPVGILEDYPYEVVSRKLLPGETVVIVTDGVDEAMNPDGDLYGKVRVHEFVRNASPNAAEVGRALLADVRKHANGRPQNDDITIMTFGRDPA